MLLSRSILCGRRNVFGEGTGESRYEKEKQRKMDEEHSTEEGRFVGEEDSME